MANEKKKPNKFILIAGPIALALVIIGVVGMSNSPSKKTTVKSASSITTAAQTTTSAKSSTTETVSSVSSAPVASGTESASTEAYSAPIIIIKSGDKNEYAQDVVYNAGTDMEEHKLGYFLPVGTYTVSNNGKTAVQINVYSKEKQKSGEWEEPADTSFAKVLMNQFDAADVEMKEGYFLYIGDGASITVKKKG